MRPSDALPARNSGFMAAACTAGTMRVMSAAADARIIPPRDFFFPISKKCTPEKYVDNCAEGRWVYINEN